MNKILKIMLWIVGVVALLGFGEMVLGEGWIEDFFVFVFGFVCGAMALDMRGKYSRWDRE